MKLTISIKTASGGSIAADVKMEAAFVSVLLFWLFQYLR